MYNPLESDTTYPVSNLRFYYEVLGDTVQEIALKSRVPMTTIEDLISGQGWVKPDMNPGVRATQAQEYYQKTREYITLAESQRVLELLPTFANLERVALEKLSDALLSLDSSDTKGVRALNQLISSLAKLLDKHPILAEAITTPSLKDRKNMGVDATSSLSELLDKLDGAGRELPTKKTKKE